MKKTYLTYALFLFSILLVNAQSPGLIYDPPGGMGPTALNPNGDGWSSTTTTGFVTDDIAESDIPYTPLPVPYRELASDLTNGNCSYSDIVSSSESESGVYMYSDGTNLNFRFRAGNTVKTSRGYSILIDTDMKFGGSGPNADPNFIKKTSNTNGNPGFEIEIVLETNFQVAVYDVDGIDNLAVPAISYSYATHHQRSVALSNNCSDPDYFYDFYVVLADLYATTGINSLTPLRYAAITALAPGPATGNLISDINGGSNFEEIINYQCGTPIGFNPTSEALCSCTNPPTLNGPIPSGSNIPITGTWSATSSEKPQDATIKVYVNGILENITPTASGSGWTMNLAGPLVNGDIIYATAIASGEGECDPNPQILIVSDCDAGNTPTAPFIDCIGNGGIRGLANPNSTIKIYRHLAPPSNPTENLVATLTVDVSGEWGWDGVSPTNNTFGGICGAGGGNMEEGTYKVYENNGICDSPFTSICLDRTGGGYPLNGSSDAPEIITEPLTTESIINGTAVTGDLIRLYINKNFVASTIASDGTFSFFESNNWYFGDLIEVTAQSDLKCESIETTKIVECAVSAPNINANMSDQIEAGNTISGTSAENGATINLYDLSAPNVSLGTATVSGGTWSSAVLATAGVTYFAKVTTACGTSKTSLYVTALAPTTDRCGSFSNTPYNENTETISGTLSTSLATGIIINLYLDDVLIDYAFTSTTTWSIPINSIELYGGANITVGIQEPGQLEFRCPVTEVVNCDFPPPFNVSPTSETINLGENASFTISGSTPGILYAIEDVNSPNIDMGVSIFSSGADFNLTSNPINSCGSFDYQIKAMTFNGNFCETVIVPVIITVVDPSIDTSTTTIGSTITSNETNASYQWLDCDNSFAEITGETNQSFDPISNGNYAVALTRNGCTLISDCVPINTLAILQNTFKQKLTLFPNPTEGKFEIKFKDHQDYLYVKLSSIRGQVINEKTINNSNKIELDIKGSAGIYFIEISDDKNNRATLKIIKY